MRIMDSKAIEKYKCLTNSEKCINLNIVPAFSPYMHSDFPICICLIKECKSDMKYINTKEGKII